MTSNVPVRTTNNADSSPSWTAYSPLPRRMSADARQSFASSSGGSTEKSGIAASSSIVSIVRKTLGHYRFDPQIGLPETHRQHVNIGRDPLAILVELRPAGNATGC